MTLVTFSDGQLSVELPKGWHELSQPELLAVYRLMALFSAKELPFEVFRELTGMELVRINGDKYFVRVQALENDCKVRLFAEVTAMQLASCYEPLAWLSDPGKIPVRLDSVGGVNGVRADLHGLKFGTFLKFENLYQGFLQSRKPQSLCAMAAVLYPGFGRDWELHPWEEINMINWAAQIKAMFTVQFPHLFRQADDESDAPSAMSMAEVMNNEIRALTGGDISKEDMVLSTDCWRALTELDYKAKEAEDFNKEMAKYKNK